MTRAVDQTGYQTRPAATIARSMKVTSWCRMMSHFDAFEVCVSILHF